MKQEQKHRVPEGQKKRLMFYLALLVAAAYFAFTNPQSSWLAIGICAGIIVTVIIGIIERRKDRKQSEFSTKNQETVENLPEESRPEETEQEDGRKE